jgi:2-phospho-L-lactate/phosphoenolpyruvate guanylyltransferase
LRADRPWALVPVKPLALAKSRLGGALDPVARRGLAERMLAHVLRVLVQSGAVERVAVITRDPEAAAFVSGHGAQVLAEPPLRDLNAIVDAGVEALGELGARRVLVLMGDLPWLEAADVSRLVALSEEGAVVLSPDHLELGTNALVLAPRMMWTCFGSPDSFARHSARAVAAGLPLEIHRSESVARDVDTPRDLEHLGRVLPTPSFAE